MRMVIVSVAAVAALVLAACSGAGSDEPRRSQSGVYIGAGGGFSQ
jgi:outer membrane biogenesis lipoprotein LolB